MLPCLQQLKALPLPGFFAWPGGQKPLLFAPRVLAVAERSDIPVVLACGGVPLTRTFFIWPGLGYRKARAQSKNGNRRHRDAQCAHDIFSNVWSNGYYRLRPNLRRRHFVPSLRSASKQLGG
jgi:hypothetical protein